MARKSSPDAPGTESTVHVTPPSVVRATRPRVPLAHTTDALVATRPRNSAFVPLCCGTHCALAFVANAAKIASVLIRVIASPLDIDSQPHQNAAAKMQYSPINATPSIHVASPSFTMMADVSVLRRSAAMSNGGKTRVSAPPAKMNEYNTRIGMTT